MDELGIGVRDGGCASVVKAGRARTRLRIGFTKTYASRPLGTRQVLVTLLACESSLKPCSRNLALLSCFPSAVGFIPTLLTAD